jgi:hypothetical protein
MNGLDEQTKAMISARMGQMADMQEKMLDQQLDQVDKLTEDDFEVLRQERRKKMVAAAEQKRRWRFLGHGELQEVCDQPEFFKAMNGESKRVVCHFYTPSNRFCPVVDQHLRKIANEHLETRFIRINAEKAPYLVEKLQVVVMPTILLALDGKVQHLIEGLSELGGQNFSSEYLAYVISTHKCCVFDKAKPERTDEDGFAMSRHEKPSIRQSAYMSDDDDIFED